MQILLIRPTQKIAGTERLNINLFQSLSKDQLLRLRLLTNLNLFAHIVNKYNKVRVESWLPEEVGTKKQLLKILLYAPIFIHRYLYVIHQMERGKRFDVICLQSRTEMIFISPILKKMGYKIVWIQHGAFFVSQAAGMIKKMYVLASRYADKIIAVSEDTRMDLLAGGIRSEKVQTLYIGIDTHMYKPVTKKSKQLCIGYLGTVTKEKGTDDFVAVARILGTEKFTYLVIGDGPEKKNMQKQIKATFTGFVDDVKKYLARVDVLLFPTHHFEGVSMAIREAVAMGIPVLATDIGGCREIITNGYNGYLYEQGNVGVMARDIRVLDRDRKKLRLMGKQAREVVLKKFNMEKQAKEFAAFFNSL